MRKLFAFDIDGTSINPFHRVTQETIDGLIELSKQGYLLVPTTGRCLDGIPSTMLNHLPLDYAITSNGSRITNMKTHLDIREDCIPKNTAIRILEILKKYRVIVNIHADGFCYDSSYGVQWARKVFFQNDFKSFPIIKDFANHLREHTMSVEKIQVFALTKRELHRCIEELKMVSGIAYPMSQNHYLEVTMASASKGSALVSLCDHLSLDLKDVIGIGDDTNDLTMFDVVGTSIAMGNGLPILKQKADHITESNRNNGFAKAITNFILK